VAPYKSISVFAHDSDPEFDRPLFHVTRFDADERAARGYVRWLSPRSVQIKPPVGFASEPKNSDLFSEVWHPAMSGKYLVWQMRS
jgi:hypothetical protein